MIIKVNRQAIKAFESISYVFAFFFLIFIVLFFIYPDENITEAVRLFLDLIAYIVGAIAILTLSYSKEIKEEGYRND